MLVLGALLLAWMLATLLRGVPQPAAPPSYGRLAQVVSLPGLSFAHPDRLFDSADYEALRQAAGPAFLATALRRERRRLALLWLRLLRDDVNTLWRFRRLLAVHGSSAGAGGELRLALAGISATALIGALRVAVSVAGPFHAAAFCRASRRRVETIWQTCAALFSRIPADRASQFEQAWAAASASTQSAFAR
jgi:hypothetical protein